VKGRRVHKQAVIDFDYPHSLLRCSERFFSQREAQQGLVGARRSRTSRLAAASIRSGERGRFEDKSFGPWMYLYLLSSTPALPPSLDSLRSDGLSADPARSNCRSRAILEGSVHIRSIFLEAPDDAETAAGEAFGSGERGEGGLREVDGGAVRRKVSGDRERTELRRPDLLAVTAEKVRGRRATLAIAVAETNRRAQTH